MRLDRPATCANGVRLGLAVAAALSLWPLPARATTRSWLDAVSGSAGTSTNWSPVGVPSYLDDANFQAVGSYTVSWASPQDTLSGLYSHGTPTVSVNGTIGVRNLFKTVEGDLNFYQGTIRANQVVVGAAGAEAHLRVSGSLATNGNVVSAASNVPAMIADDGSFSAHNTARVYLTGGGTLLSNSWIETSRTSFASCSLFVSGYRYLFGSYYRSTLGTLTSSGGGSRGDVILGVAGGSASHTYLDLTNGAVLDVKHSLQVGSGCSAIVRMYETVANTNPRIYVLGNTVLGVDPTSAADGSGHLFVQAGTARLGGDLILGDDDHTIGNTGYGAFHALGGTTIIGGAIRMSPANSGTFELPGGSVRLLSGSSVIQQTEPLSVSSSVGSPEFVVSGSAVVNSYPGTSSPLALGVGRGGAGLLRVEGPNAYFQALGPVVIADSSGGTGVVEADSAGHFGSNESITVGVGGSLIARRGAFITTPLADGPTRILSNGTVTLEDAWIIASSGVFAEDGTFSGYGSLYGSFENLSDFQVPAGQRLDVVGALDNRGGTISGGGVILVDTDHFQSSGLVTATVHVNAATLLPHEPLPFALPEPPAATGRPAQDGLAAAIVPPLGHLQIAGDLSFISTSSHVEIRIGSRASGQRDTVEVSGQAQLGGTLDLMSIAGNPPLPGDTLTVLSAGAVSGTFAVVTLDGDDPGTNLGILYGPTDVRVVFTGSSTAVDDGPGHRGLPTEVRLSAIRSAGQAAFVVELPAASHVRLRAFDVSGREIAALADADLDAGRHTFALRSVASGIYFARAEIVSPHGRIVRTARVAVLQ